MASASETIGTPKMIVPYEWILENVGQEPMTIASKMILFRGEKVFRVGLQNHAISPILFVVAIGLNKIGMEVEDVKYGIQSSWPFARAHWPNRLAIGPAKMEEMTQQNIGDNGNLQLFTTTLDEKVVGNRTFVFRICIEGTDSGYSYQLCDRLAKDQLWAALKNYQHLADVEFIVKGKIFLAHKAILAARSQVFADEFEKKHSVKGVRHQIRIDDVEPSTVENFLHFIYTGEPMGTLADEKLLKLAYHYQVTTLENLCQHALKEMDSMQMAKVRKCLNGDAEELSVSKIMPEKETEIFFDRTTPTFRCTSTLQISAGGNEEPKCMMQYQNENICIAYFTGKVDYNEHFSNFFYIAKSVINLSCAKHRRFGLKVEDVYCKLLTSYPIYDEWLKMDAEYSQKNSELLHFSAQSQRTIGPPSPSVNFDVKFISTIGNYYYEMMDDGWLKDFWVAATNEKFTDVDIFVGTQKVMEVHRFILSARSPVMNVSLNKISNTRKSIVRFGAEFDVEVVKNFLNFLYTGSLKSTDNVQLLSKLATMYQVETLKNVCQPFQLINANPPDVEEVTDYLLQL